MNTYLANTEELIIRSNACLTYSKLYVHYQIDHNFSNLFDYFNVELIEKYFDSVDNLIAFIINDNKSSEEIEKFIKMNDEVLLCK